MGFKSEKVEILKQYDVAIKSGLVDNDMIAINALINTNPHWVTTSSCFGRIIIISKNNLRSKYQTEFLFKSHSPSTVRNIKLENMHFSNEFWMLLEPPNIHVRCHNLELGKQLVTYALESKLGRSKYQSVYPKIVVELLGTTNMQIPLGESGKMIIQTEYFDYLCSKMEGILMEEQNRIQHFAKKLSK